MGSQVIISKAISFSDDCQLPGKGPTDVDDAPVPALISKSGL